MDVAVEQPVTTLSRDDIVFHPSSFIDPNGRLFWWKGGLYRGIASARAEFYLDLFHRGIVDDLIDRKLLVPTTLTPYSFEGYPVVVRHAAMPFVTYPFEWPAAALRDAALLTLALQRRLAELGLALQDAHPWNILFDGHRPVWVDFGSISTPDLGGTWPVHDEFKRFFLYPLQLMRAGHDRLARMLLHDVDSGVTRADLVTIAGGTSLRLSAERLVGLIKRRLPASAKSRLKRVAMGMSDVAVPRRPLTDAARVAFVDRHVDEIKAVRLSTGSSAWTDYYAEDFPSFVAGPSWHHKQRSVHRLLASQPRSRVLDIGSNRGWYALLAASAGHTVAAMDCDEATAAQLYAEAQRRDVSVLPLVMDIRNPSPGYGVGGEWLPAASSRLKSDIVLALAIVHHLAFRHSLRFDVIATALASFTGRMLVVEFVPPEDRWVSQWMSPRHDWYSLENFQRALHRHFSTVRLHPSSPTPRVLLECHR